MTDLTDDYMQLRETIDSFIQKETTHLLSLPPMLLEFCAGFLLLSLLLSLLHFSFSLDIAHTRKGCHLALVSSLYRLCIQRYMKEHEPNLTDLSRIYQRLLSTSIDRKRALDVLSECIQLMSSYSPPSSSIEDDDDEHHASFLEMDAICGKAFNWGITLMDLGHPQQAEKFIAKALSLLVYTTTSFKKEWEKHIRDTYDTVLDSAAQTKEKQQLVTVEM